MHGLDRAVDDLCGERSGKPEPQFARGAAAQVREHAPAVAAARRRFCQCNGTRESSGASRDGAASALPVRRLAARRRFAADRIRDETSGDVCRRRASE